MSGLCLIADSPDRQPQLWSPGASMPRAQGLGLGEEGGGSGGGGGGGGEEARVLGNNSAFVAPLETISSNQMTVSHRYKPDVGIPGPCSSSARPGPALPVRGQPLRRQPGRGGQAAGTADSAHTPACGGQPRGCTRADAQTHTLIHIYTRHKDTHTRVCTLTCIHIHRLMYDTYTHMHPNTCAHICTRTNAYK